jgi:hypothetical protein
MDEVNHIRTPEVRQLDPMMQETTLTNLRESVRQALAQVWAQYEGSQTPNAETRDDAASDRPAPGGVCWLQ